MTSTIQQEFPNLFTGLGTLQGDPYTICIKTFLSGNSQKYFVTSSRQSSRDTQPNGSTRCHLKSTTAHSVVRGDGCDKEKIRRCKDLRRPQAIEQMRDT